MVNNKVYSAILKLQSNAARVELIYDWPIFLSTSNSLTNFYLESDIPGTLKASPLLQISSSIPVKKLAKDSVAGYKCDSGYRTYIQKDNLVPSLVPEGSNILNKVTQNTETVEKYIRKDEKLFVKLQSKTEVELPSGNYSVTIQRFSKLSTAFNGQRNHGYLIGMNKETVFVLFPAQKTWEHLPTGVSTTSPHNGDFNSSSLQILSFPLDSAARFITPVTSFVFLIAIVMNWMFLMIYVLIMLQFHEDVQITSRKTKTKTFHKLSETLVSEANGAFPRLGDQLSFIQMAVEKYNLNKTDRNLLEVQSFLNGFVEIVIVDGTGRELQGSGLLVTQEPTFKHGIDRDSKIGKKKKKRKDFFHNVVPLS